jgi:CrcB protein
MRVLLVVLAGGLGAATRYLVSVLFISPRFPWATLGINLVGSLLLGALVGAAAHRQLHPAVVSTLGAGFLGGFTTFSTFSLEALQLLRAHRPAAALTYLLLSAIGGVLTAAVGYIAMTRTG